MSESLQPEQLRAGLGLLDPSLVPSDAVRRYQAYYGLDLPHHPTMESRLGLMSVGDYQVVTQLWWPPEPRATLLILHGYYDHMGLYRHVVDWALSLNFCVLACDLPGHGLSSGARASIRSFEEYQRVLAGLLQEARRLALPNPIHLLGQSTGGAIISDYLLHSPAAQPITGQSILLAPLVRPRDWRRARLAYHLLQPLVSELPRRFSENSGDQEFLDFVQCCDPLQPRLLPTAWVGALARWIPRIESAQGCAHKPIIIQGELDATVDWQHNLPVLAQKFRQPEVLRLPNARHHLANESEPIRLQFFNYLRDQLEGSS